MWTLLLGFGEVFLKFFVMTLYFAQIGNGGGNK